MVVIPFPKSRRESHIEHVASVQPIEKLAPVFALRTRAYEDALRRSLDPAGFSDPWDLNGDVAHIVSRVGDDIHAALRIHFSNQAGTPLTNSIFSVPALPNSAAITRFVVEPHLTTVQRIAALRALFQLLFRTLERGGVQYLYLAAVEKNAKQYMRLLGATPLNVAPRRLAPFEKVSLYYVNLTDRPLKQQLYRLLGM